MLGVPNEGIDIFSPKRRTGASSGANEGSKLWAQLKSCTSRAACATLCRRIARKINANATFSSEFQAALQQGASSMLEVVQFLFSENPVSNRSVEFIWTLAKNSTLATKQVLLTAKVLSILHTTVEVGTSVEVIRCCIDTAQLAELALRRGQLVDIVTSWFSQKNRRVSEDVVKLLLLLKDVLNFFPQGARELAGTDVDKQIYSHLLEAAKDRPTEANQLRTQQQLVEAALWCLSYMIHFRQNDVRFIIQVLAVVGQTIRSIPHAASACHVAICKTVNEAQLVESYPQSFVSLLSCVPYLKTDKHEVVLNFLLLVVRVLEDAHLHPRRVSGASGSPKGRKAAKGGPAANTSVQALLAQIPTFAQYITACVPYLITTNKFAIYEYFLKIVDLCMQIADPHRIGFQINYRLLTYAKTKLFPVATPEGCIGKIQAEEAGIAADRIYRLQWTYVSIMYRVSNDAISIGLARAWIPLLWLLEKHFVNEHQVRQVFREEPTRHALQQHDDFVLTVIKNDMEDTAALERNEGKERTKAIQEYVDATEGIFELQYNEASTIENSSLEKKHQTVVVPCIHFVQEMSHGVRESCALYETNVTRSIETRIDRLRKMLDRSIKATRKTSKDELVDDYQHHVLTQNRIQVANERFQEEHEKVSQYGAWQAEMVRRLLPPRSTACLGLYGTTTFLMEIEEEVERGSGWWQAKSHVSQKGTPQQQQQQQQPSVFEQQQKEWDALVAEAANIFEPATKQFRLLKRALGETERTSDFVHLEILWEESRAFLEIREMEDRQIMLLQLSLVTRDDSNINVAYEILEISRCTDASDSDGTSRLQIPGKDRKRILNELANSFNSTVDGNFLQTAEEHTRRRLVGEALRATTRIIELSHTVLEEEKTRHFLVSMEARSIRQAIQDYAFRCFKQTTIETMCDVLMERVILDEYLHRAELAAEVDMMIGIWRRNVHFAKSATPSQVVLLFDLLTDV